MNRRVSAEVLDRDEVNHIMSSGFYAPAPARLPADVEPRPKRLARTAEKPEHYKVICISLYTGDLEALDAMVDGLKKRGLTKANRSALIRYALAQVDLDKVPRGL